MDSDRNLIQWFGTREPATLAVRVVDNSLNSFKKMRPSPRDTCASQRQMVEQNSVFDSLKRNKVVAYCAPCDCPELYAKPKTKPKPETGGKTLIALLK